MTIADRALVADLVQWIAEGPRAYSDVMRAWRTSCPRLTIWEDAVDLGLVAREFRGADGLMVVVTPGGRSFLAAEGRAALPKLND